VNAPREKLLLNQICEQLEIDPLTESSDKMQLIVDKIDALDVSSK
jgi:hypothetical protein